MNAITAIDVSPMSATSTTSSTHKTPNSTSFGDMVMAGLGQVEEKSALATDAIANYAVGNPVSTHELMIAMEKAKMSVHLTVEIRNRLLEAYQELSRMQI